MSNLPTAIPSFAGLNNAPVFERGNPLKPGTFDLKIERVIAKRTFAKGDALIVEFTILNANGHPEHRAGDKVGWFQGLTNSSVALPSIKAFLVAALGYNYKLQKAEVEEKVAPNLEGILAEAINNKGLDGKTIHVTTFQRPTKKQVGTDPQGQPVFGVFTVHEWEPSKPA